MNMEIHFIRHTEIIKTAAARDQLFREEALAKMYNELTQFFEECYEEAKVCGFAAKLSKGKEFNIPDYFKNVNGEYSFPVELKKALEDAGYTLYHKDGSNVYTVK